MVTARHGVVKTTIVEASLYILIHVSLRIRTLKVIYS